jgi:hypothetical protein
MSDHDRGAYTPPTDSPLSFDARRPVRGGGGGSSILLISAVILLVLIVGAGIWLYRDGLRGDDDAPQPVGAAVETAKVEPKAADQPETDPAAGLTIHTDDGGVSGEPTFAPEPEPVLPRPAPTTAPTTAELRPAAPANPPVAVAPKPVAPVAVAPKPVAPAPAPAATGAAMVQIGAFSSQALADKGWNDAAAVSPGIAAGKGKRVETVEKDGKTLFRTSVTGFASRADAAAFCDRLKAAGKSCFVK